jgi:hypothetical protein
MKCATCTGEFLARAAHQRFCSPKCKQAGLRQRVKVRGLVLDGIEPLFWALVRKSDTCWEWTGGLHCGYGRLVYRGQDLEAHRISYTLAFGPIPAELFVCHHCDNRRCVHPDHFFLGDIVDNTADRDRKGRQAKGETISRAFATGERIVLRDHVTGRIMGTKRCLALP